MKLTESVFNVGAVVKVVFPSGRETYIDVKTTKSWVSYSDGCYLNAVALEFVAPKDVTVVTAAMSSLEALYSESSELDELLERLPGSLLKEMLPLNAPVRHFVVGQEEVETAWGKARLGHFEDCTWYFSKTVADLPDDVVFGCSVFSKDFEDKIKELREKTLLDVDSGVSRILQGDLEDDLRRLVSENRKGYELPIPQLLADEEMKLLREHFPGINLRFTKCVDGPHNVAAAHRVLETWELVHSFPRDEPVIDIGGNWFYHIRYGNENVHSCCPILDPRDAARQTHRCVMLETMMSNLQCKYARVLNSDGESRRDKAALENFYKEWAVHPKVLIALHKKRFPNQGMYCHNHFGENDCDFQAKYAMMIHSGYDIPLDNLIRGLDYHGVLELRGYMIADPAMLVNDKGYLPFLRCHWEKKSGYIWFSFKDDSTMGYRHKWSVYSQYLKRTVIRSRGNMYVLERDKYRHGTLSYTLIRCGAKVPPGIHTLYHNAWFRELFDRYVISVPYIQLKSLKDPEGSTLGFRDVVIARDLVDRVVEICLRGVKDSAPLDLVSLDVKTHSANLQLVQTHLLSHSQTVVLNGTTIVRANPIPIEDFSPLSLSIYFEVILTKKKESLMFNWMANDCDDGFLSKAWYKVMYEFLVTVLLFPFKQMLKGFKYFVSFFESKKFIHSLIKEPVEKLTILEKIVQEVDNSREITDGLLAGTTIRDVCTQFKDYVGSVDFFTVVEKLVKLEEKENEPEVALDEFLERDVPVCVVDSAVRPFTADPENKVQLAVSEYIAYNSTEHERVVGELRDAYLNVLASNGVAGYYNSKDHFGVFSRSRGWLLKPTELNHEAGYSGELVWITYDGDTPVWEGQELLIVNDHTKLMNGVKLARAVADQFELISMSKLPVVTMVDGVTGCGKTTEIIKTGNNPKTIILSVCKANVEEIRKVIPGSKKRVRTVDSFLLEPNVRCEILFIDEYGLAHPGSLLAAMILSRCKTCVLFGDSEQIPFCNRIDDFKLSFDTIEKVIDIKREVRELTYRCPKDITVILQSLYERKRIHTASKVDESIQIKSIKSENDIPLPSVFPKEVIYICMTKHDQALLSLRWKKEGVTSEVRTVHAAQGLSYPYVVYFRLTRTDNDLFTSSRKPYHLVAISRHKEGIIYATTKIEDSKDFSLRLLRMRYKASKNFVQENAVHDQLCTPRLESLVNETYCQDLEISERATRAAADNFPISTEPLFVVDQDGVFSVREKVGRSIGNANAVVCAIEELCPGNTLYDDTGINDMVNNGPLRCEVGNVRIDLSQLSGKQTVNPIAEPILPTGSLTRRQVHPKQTLLAVEKRNANVLNCQGFSDKRKIAMEAVDKFFKYFFDKEKLDGLPKGVVGTSEEMIQTYLNKAKKNVAEHAVLAQTHIERYRHMIKRDIKPVLSDALQSEYTKAATITYHDTDITQIATAFFTVIKQRIMACKTRRLCIPIDAESDVSRILTRDHLGSETGDFIEIDFSKFDKSQNEIHQLMQDEILLRLGGSLEFVSLWSQAHKHSKIKDFNCGISFNTDYQRRTGDAFTFLGNTLVTACMLSYVLDDNSSQQIRYMLVGGDDSLICSVKPIRIELGPLATIFNMSCKLIQPACPYFASRYIVRVRDELVCVPDPMKLLVKMGRKDLPDNEESLEEVRIGLLDSCRNLLDDDVKTQVCMLTQLRYGRKSPSLFDALGFIAKALTTKENFKSLYKCTNSSTERRVVSDLRIR
ncbi:putative viral replicase [Camellia yellow ringspot virus]|nr:putative viral replicase [Camellia yellow ringspot virus]